MQLVLIDLSPKKKKTDLQIAEEWGLASERSVQEVRASESYAILKQELIDHALSYAGDQVQQIAEDAIYALVDIVPDYAQRVKELLQPPRDPNIVEWTIPTARMKAATSGVNTLLKIAELTRPPETKKEQAEGSIRMPSMVLAESQVETVRQYREREVTITVSTRENPVDGEWEILD